MAGVAGGRTLLTYSDYVRFPEDGNRHELIGGVHYATPSPVTKHQRISRWIQYQLFKAIEVPGHGQVIYAPMDVLLSDSDVVQPDILVVLEANRGILLAKHVRGAPDLVVEITSPSTRARDLELKKDLYERFGVPEYWVVLTGEDAVDRYVLEDGAYRASERCTERIAPEAFPAATVDLTKVW